MYRGGSGELVGVDASLQRFELILQLGGIHVEPLFAVQGEVKRRAPAQSPSHRQKGECWCGPTERAWRRVTRGGPHRGGCGLSYQQTLTHVRLRYTNQATRERVCVWLRAVTLSAVSARVRQRGGGLGLLGGPSRTAPEARRG